MIIPSFIEKNKHIFGTYSAMALMNIRTVLNHIQKVTNIEGEMPKSARGDELEDYWKHPVIIHLNNFVSGDKYPEKTNAVIEKLMHCFPFLNIMANNQREYTNRVNGEKRLEINGNDIFSVLSPAFKVLKKYRDYTCHYLLEDHSWDDGSKFMGTESYVSIIINNYYDVALRNVKKKYNYSTEQLAFIQDNRYIISGQGNNKRCKTNYDFFLSMQNTNNDKTNKPHLSGAGVAQLISLFLEKKYVNTFISQIHLNDKYPEQGEEYKIIRRSMAINSIVIPKERLKSDKKGIAIALDMLNELKRCPKEVFETLSFEDQSRFRVLSSDHNEVLQMRNTDRFAQLILQHIDYNKLFKGIRFHVNMGKLRYLFSPDKLCIDGERRVRVIEHPLNGYGRIDEIEEYRKGENGTFGESGITIRDFEHTQRDDADSNNYPYIVDTYTHYILKNNKIEFCFNKENIIPKIENEFGKWYVIKQIPHCRMSTLELPAMIFHMHLLGHERTEARIAEVYNNYTKLFTALNEGTLTTENINSFGINKEDMPQKVIDAVNGISIGKSYNAFLVKSLKEMYTTTKALLERVKADERNIVSRNNKMGRPGYRELSPGNLADFLAKDIVRFQPSLNNIGTDRLTGLNYRVMQATIATYNIYNDGDAFTKLNQMFQKAGLVAINSKRSHPFLFEVLRKRPQNTIELYKFYLIARKRHLEKLINNCENGVNVDVPFINRDRNKWLVRDEEFYKELGTMYLEDNAIELPRQMFDNEIKNALKQLPQMQDVDFDNANTTYLVGEYIKRVLNDESQEFYSYKRNYRYIDLLKCVCDKKESIIKQFTTTDERELIWKERAKRKENYLYWADAKRSTDKSLSRMSDAEYDKTIEQRISNSRIEFQKNEKIIRRYKVQDALLFILVTDTLKKHIEFDAKDFKLKDIMPEADKGILSEIMPIDFIFEKGGKKYTIHTDGIKLKNYGDFYSIAHDKRIDSLFDILPQRVVNKEDIKNEFDSYDTNRPKVVKLILDFEKLAFEKHPEMKELVTAESHFDFSSILKELMSIQELSNTDTRILSQIRNAFNHNVYPNAGIVEIRTLPEVAKHLIEIFGRHARIEK